MDLVEKLAPSEKKKEIVHGVGARNVREPATKDNFAPPKRMDDCENLNWLELYHGAARDERH
jgi:hypothetical protein